MKREIRNYSEDRKSAILNLLKPPINKSYREVAKEEGIPVSTIYTWQKKENKVCSMAKKTSNLNKTFSPEQQFAVIIETATMSETELSAYCRSHGLYPEHIQSWKEAFIEGVSKVGLLKREEKNQLNQDKKKIRSLEKELNRKEKALAEAAALLMLRKKLEAFYGEGNEDD